MLQATGRVVSSCHRREEEDLAQGNVLPRPQQSMHCSFAAHCELFFEPGASLIAGGSFWHYNVGRRLGREDPRAACMCRSVFPSRVHLVWACPALAHLWVGLRAPECRASERLLALPQHGVPPQPQGQTDDGVDALVEHLLKFGQDRAELVVATDGSSKEGVAAWAVSADCQEPMRVARLSVQKWRPSEPFLLRCSASVGGLLTVRASDAMLTAKLRLTLCRVPLAPVLCFPRSSANFRRAVPEVASWLRLVPVFTQGGLGEAAFLRRGSSTPRNKLQLSFAFLLASACFSASHLQF